MTDTEVEYFRARVAAAKARDAEEALRALYGLPGCDAPWIDEAMQRLEAQIKLLEKRRDRLAAELACAS
jgi:hypothetical protein